MNEVTRHAQAVFEETATEHRLDGLRELLAGDLREDVRPNGLDVTTWAMIDERTQATAYMRPREAGRLAGINLIWVAADLVDPALEVELCAKDGTSVSPGAGLARFTGDLSSILLLERTALNLVTHLSGVATLASRFVESVAGTDAAICDTRKTLPGLRGLQKYAATCGGVTPHRYGLSDAALVKDNHLAGVPLDRLRETLVSLTKRARGRVESLAFVEVEVDTHEQLAEVLKAPVDMVLLDNMTNPQLREAVAMRDAAAPSVQLEASGGVNLDTVRGIAETGVDRISVGAITHSAPALDIGLDIDPVAR